MGNVRINIDGGRINRIENNGRRVGINGKLVTSGHVVDGGLEPLKSKPIRYLPPAGPYYDQHDLAAHFGTAFESGRCINCLDFDCKAPYLELCTRNCGVCNTGDHIGKACQQLYCAHGWWRARRHTPRAEHHIRPVLKEAQALSNDGMICAIQNTFSDILPNATHRIVASFYKNKPEPRRITLQPVKDTSGSPMDDDLPQLKAPNSSPPMVKRPSPDSRAENNNAMHESHKATSNESEVYIQGLEERLMSEQRANAEQAQAIASMKQEVTQLRNDGVLKDRQLRQLNADIAALRARLPEAQKVGSKRLRTDDL